MEFEDKAKALEERLEQEYPESVILDEEKHTIIGKFVRVDTGPTSYGPQPIFVFELRNGQQVGLWGVHAVLRSQFARCRPQPGDIVGVRFLGEKQSGSGTTYKNYRVEKWAEGGDATIDWSEIDPSAVVGYAPPEDAPIEKSHAEHAREAREQVESTKTPWDTWGSAEV